MTGEWLDFVTIPVGLAVTGCCLGLGALFFWARPATVAPRQRRRVLSALRAPAILGAGALAVATGVLTLERFIPDRLHRWQIPEIPQQSFTAILPPSGAYTPGTFPLKESGMIRGQQAPNFTLMDVRTGHEVQLSTARKGRPVVLIFGSFGCDVFCGQVPRLRRLHEEYKNDAVFLFVHVRDAPHPLPTRVAEAFHKAGVEAPLLGNRRERARLGAEVMGLPFPCLVDSSTNETETLYHAWPERLVVVGTDGRIVLDAGLGVFSRGPDGPGWDFRAIENCLRAEASKRSHDEDTAPPRSEGTPRSS